jgi:hypothetical protein
LIMQKTYLHKSPTLLLVKLIKTIHSDPIVPGCFRTVTFLSQLGTTPGVPREIGRDSSPNLSWDVTHSTYIKHWLYVTN